MTALPVLEHQPLAADAADAEGPMSAGSTLRRLGARLRHDRFAQLGIAVLVVLALLAIFAPLVSFFSPIHGALLDANQGPSARHWLGTDSLGLDTWTRVVYGARVAWIAGLEAVAVGALGGIPLGIVLGFRGGRADRWSSRVIDGIIAVPGLVLAIALITVIGRGVYQAMFAVGVVFATILVRFARGEAKAAREELWVTSALATGASERRVMRRHVLPTIAPALIVQITLLFGAAILAEAGLSFIGLGMQPPNPSWGGMLTSAQDTISSHPWLAVPPGVAIAIMVLAVNAVGDGLGDALGRGRTTHGTLGGVLAQPRPTAPALSVVDAEPAPLETSPAPDPKRLVLRVEDLSVAFPGPDGGFVPVLDNVSLEVAAGEIMALVGETGSGKSILAKAVLGIVPAPAEVTAGSIEVDLLEVTGRSRRAMRRVRGRRVGVVFQEPQAALNPALRIGDQLTETLRLQAGLGRKEAATRAVELLDQVGIPRAASRVRAYPHEFSGGMAQRVMIALALACDPALLIADEPTTALDVTIQAQILDLLLDLRAEHNMATLLITHDFGVVADVADRATVLYAGQVVETGSCERLFAAPRHPYTAGLLQAVPRSRPRSGSLVGIPGSVPLPGSWPAGCRFADRCEHVRPACREAVPPLVSQGGDAARCLREDELHLLGSVERTPA